jgi:hypothetical protein
MRALSTTIAITIVVLLAGCGGEELTGDPDVPEGYTLYRGDGVSFAHPEGYEAETKTNANGIKEVTLRDPAGGDDAAYVHLSIAPDRGDDIEPLVRSLRVTLESALFKGEVSDDREVDVDGATAARRLDARQPDRSGNVFEREALLVLAPDGNYYTLSAIVPEGGEDALDRDAVIRSFRLVGEDAEA